MPEPIVLALALLAAGVAVLWPLRRAPSAADVTVEERRAAEARHRVALESLRDVETDRRAGSLDDAAYAAALAEGEANVATTRAALDRLAAAPVAPARPPSPSRSSRVSAVAVAVAGLIAVLLVAGSLVPAAGIANRTEINEGLAAARAAEESRQERIAELTAAFAADPTDVAVLSELADAYLAGSSPRDLAAAAASLQLLIAAEPGRADAYERIVAAYVRANDFINARAALEAYEGIEAADPAEVAFFDGLIALRGEGDEERAVAAFDRFLDLAPDDGRAEMIRSLRDDAEREP